jgi:hypothetical protein
MFSRSINDTSRVIRTTYNHYSDNSRGVIYDLNIFIIHTTDPDNKVPNHIDVSRIPQGKKLVSFKAKLVNGAWCMVRGAYCMVHGSKLTTVNLTNFANGNMS